MTVSEFIDHWIDTKECGGASNSFQEGNDKLVLYLKDWHFVTVQVLKFSFSICFFIYLFAFGILVFIMYLTELPRLQGF